ncbi:MAG: DUF418 domain-containing protein [Erythrobacter sp.]|uniref:DUF418 domain-containing protein n=1 Tax=Erythrobacter sp. TaxID=1042 RepID=UPI00329725E3
MTASNSTDQGSDSPDLGAAESAPQVVSTGPVAAKSRIETLDFIRGIAVLGILAANIVAFGQPFSAYAYPGAWIGTSGDPDGWLWIAQFVAVDGKMRGLFTLLFGAGMYLFMERAWARGDTAKLQAWRLCVLFVFGFAHFLFIWIGDILAMYAIIGLIALTCIGWNAKTQIIVGLIGYGFGAMVYSLFSFPYYVIHTSLGDAEGMERTKEGLSSAFQEAMADDKLATAFKKSGDYLGLIQHRFNEDWYSPITISFIFFLETLPLMLLGMGLYRLGFFSGGFNRRKLALWGGVSVTLGGIVSLGLAFVVKDAGFEYWASNAALMGWSPLPRLSMVLGLAALMVAFSPSWTGWLAARVRAAGRAAFTNYLGTSVVMLFVFHGWAFGLFGELTRPQLYLVTLLMCGLMLAWSKPWLDRFRYGPLEWLWRCLTYRRMFPLR